MGMMKVRVEKIGKVENYVGLPITNRFLEGTAIDPEELKTVGVVTSCVEVDGMFELQLDMKDDSIFDRVKEQKSFSISGC